MTRQTLASIVAEVSHRPPLVADRSLFPSSRQNSSRTAPTPSFPDPEHEAHQRGVREGLALAQHEIATAAAANEEHLQQALAHERLRLLDGEGQSLASSLVSAMTSLEQSIADQVVPILRHLVEARLLDRAMTELSQILLKAIASNGAHEMTITCSPELIASVKSYLPPDWNHAKFVEGNAPGIQVVVSDADMRVDLETWRQSITGGIL